MVTYDLHKKKIIIELLQKVENLVYYKINLSLNGKVLNSVASVRIYKQIL